jgi:hypothetical protein
MHWSTRNGLAYMSSARPMSGEVKLIAAAGGGMLSLMRVNAYLDTVCSCIGLFRYQ